MTKRKANAREWEKSAGFFGVLLFCEVKPGWIGVIHACFDPGGGFHPMAGEEQATPGTE